MIFLVSEKVPVFSKHTKQKLFQIQAKIDH